MNDDTRRNGDTRPTANSVGWLAIALALFFALLMGGFYYFAYLPQTVALSAAMTEGERARAEADRAMGVSRRLEQEGLTLRAQIVDLEGVLSGLQRTSAELEEQVRIREAELAATRSTQDALIGELQSEIEGGMIQVERLRDSLRVDVVNEILFDSGETEIKQDGLEVLRRVGAILKEVKDKQVIVQGHTDYVTIGGRLAQRYPTNWELSAARAVNVVRFLQEEVGIDPTRLAASGFSEYRPRADNATPEGRRLNRRIEIVLAPVSEPFSEEAPVEVAPPGD